MIIMKKTWKQMIKTGMALVLGSTIMITSGAETAFAAVQELYGKDSEMLLPWADRPEKGTDLLKVVDNRQQEESMLSVSLGNHMREIADILEDGEPKTVWESKKSNHEEPILEGMELSGIESNGMESDVMDSSNMESDVVDSSNMESDVMDSSNMDSSCTEPVCEEIDSAYGKTQVSVEETDQNSAGTDGDELMRDGELSQPTLTDQPDETVPRKADFTLSMKADAEVLKAGEITVYEVELVNTGDILLTDLKLSSSFSCPYVTQEWQPAVNLTAEQSEARLSLLEPGQTVFLYLAAQLTPEQTNPLVHNVTVTACNYEDPLELLTRESVVESKIDPLKVDFAVEKTADRQVAVPGDTITYQICIRNTGERTLHSIVGTERFLNSGLQVRFLEKEGVVLNETKDKAMISSLLPGESITLQAQVTLSKEAVSQELINQITVVTAETGERTITSQTAVQITVPEMTASPTPVEYLYHNNEVSDNYEEKSVPRTPKTGDFSGTELFLALLGVSAAYLLMSLALFLGKVSSRGHHRERNH